MRPARVRWSAMALGTLSVLVLGVGCAGGDDPTSGTAAATTTPSTLPDIGGELPCPPAGQFVGPEAFTTTAVAEPGLTAGAPTTWVIGITNVTADPVVLAFFDGQSADVTLTRDGTVAYRWSEGRSFTQGLRCETIEAGATWELRLAEDRPLPPAGPYDLAVTFRSTPLPPDVTRAVDVAP